MRTLVLGAGATGGYLGGMLLAAGRDVTFLVRPQVADRLSLEGLQLRGLDGVTRSQLVPSALTTDELRSTYDLVIVAVRGLALLTAIEDLRAAVGPDTQIVPLLNGMGHLDALVAAFDPHAVLGATAWLGATLLPHGTIVEQAPGIALELGRLQGGSGQDAALEAVGHELAVGGVSVSVVGDVRAAMRSKWLFIAAATTVTALTGVSTGEATAVVGGPALIREVVAETSAIARAAGHATSGDALLSTLSDPTSRFVPSLTRELWAGRPVEVEVLDELAALAHRHGVHSRLLDAARVRVRVGPDHEPDR